MRRLTSEPRLTPEEPIDEIECPNCDTAVAEVWHRHPAGEADCPDCGARVFWETDTTDGETLDLFVSADPDVDEMQQAVQEVRQSLRLARAEVHAAQAEINEAEQELKLLLARLRACGVKGN